MVGTPILPNPSMAECAGWLHTWRCSLTGAFSASSCEAWHTRMRPAGHEGDPSGHSRRHESRPTSCVWQPLEALVVDHLHRVWSRCDRRREVGCPGPARGLPPGRYHGQPRLGRPRGLRGPARARWMASRGWGPVEYRPSEHVHHADGVARVFGAPTDGTSSIGSRTTAPVGVPTA